MSSIKKLFISKGLVIFLALMQLLQAIEIPGDKQKVQGKIRLPYAVNNIQMMGHIDIMIEKLTCDEMGNCMQNNDYQMLSLLNMTPPIEAEESGLYHFEALFDNASSNTSAYVLRIETTKPDGSRITLSYQVGFDEDDMEDHSVDGDEKLVENFIHPYNYVNFYGQVGDFGTLDLGTHLVEDNDPSIPKNKQKVMGKIRLPYGIDDIYMMGKLDIIIDKLEYDNSGYYYSTGNSQTISLLAAIYPDNNPSGLYSFSTLFDYDDINTSKYTLSIHTENLDASPLILSYSMGDGIHDNLNHNYIDLNEKRHTHFINGDEKIIEYNPFEHNYIEFYGILPTPTKVVHT